jgi:REP element-mobilizing transposase RayT
MDRCWFLTWRTYGTRLPGSRDGFVDPILDDDGNRVIHNVPGTPMDSDNPALENYAKNIMKGPPVYLHLEQAKALLEQFKETAHYRHWHLLAVAILVNHVHLIVGVDGDPDPADLLRDFKAYGSRRLNREWPRPANGSWWTESGSRRRLKGDANIAAGTDYVIKQESPLLVWQPDAEKDAPAGVTTP